MKTKYSFARFLILAGSLCAASTLLHAATPSATFTDSWTDTAVPDSTFVVTTTGSFTFSATVPLEGEITSSDVDSNSQFSISIGPVGSTQPVFSDTVGDAQSVKLGASGSAKFSGAIFTDPFGNGYQGSLTVSWTRTTLTVSGTATGDILGEEGAFLMNSVGIAAGNDVNMAVTNEVDLSLADNTGATFNDDTNLVGSLKNTETEFGGGTNAVPLEAGSDTGKGGGITFSDSWKDSGASQTLEGPSAGGSFSFSGSLALDSAITTSDLDSNSQFSLNIGSVGIVTNTLGEASDLKLGSKGSATFLIPVVNPISGDVTASGTLTLSWTPTTLTISGTAPGDVLGEEAGFAMSSIGIGASNDVNMHITNEVDVSLSDNTGATFYDQDTNAVGSLRNTETEFGSGTNAFPLEAGSETGSGGGISFSDTWKDSAAPIGYYASTSGSASVSISLPLEGVAGITNDIDISDITTNSELTLSLGVPGTPPIFDHFLQQASKITANKSGGSATFEKNGGGGSLTLTWTTTTMTLTLSTTSDFLGEEQNYESNSVDVPGTQTITGPYQIGMTLTDTNGGEFIYYNPFVPVTGKDTETEKVGADGTPTPLQAGTVTGTADFTPPAVTFTTPASGSKVYNSAIQLQGKASDKAGVSSILYYVNNDTANEIEIDQDELPTNSISWSTQVDLGQFGGPGTFTVSVLAIDNYGNVSAPVTHTVQWIVTNYATVTVTPTGTGTVKGLKTGQLLDVGNSYSVTATPSSKNWIFSYWSDAFGDILSSNATFEYYDIDGALTANFAGNRFTADPSLAGSYTCLYMDTNESVVRDDGYMTMTVTSTGAFTGKIHNADYSVETQTISGQLSESTDGSYATATLPLVLFGTHDYLQVSLSIDTVSTDPEPGLLTGFVNSFSSAAMTNLTDSAELMGKVTFYNTNVLTGLYNIVIAPVSGDPSQGPGGYSYGTAAVSKTGSVAVVLNLADGVSPAISFSSTLAQDGTCPFYAALYGGNAVLSGWMQFATDRSGGMYPAPMTWFTENYNSALLPNGVAFSAQPPLSGGLYVAPKAGVNIFGSTALDFDIDTNYSGLSLPDEIDLPVTFNLTRSTFTVPENTDKLSITLTPTTGALSGSFITAPGSKSTFSYKGVVVDSVGYGFYTSTNKETGPVILSPDTLDASFLRGPEGTEEKR